GDNRSRRGSVSTQRGSVGVSNSATSALASRCSLLLRTTWGEEISTIVSSAALASALAEAVVDSCGSAGAGGSSPFVSLHAARAGTLLVISCCSSMITCAQDVHADSEKC